MKQKLKLQNLFRVGFGILFLNLIFNISGYAKTLMISEGDNIPPYAIPAEDKGASVDVIRAAMKKSGYKVNFMFVPLARVSEVLDKFPELDGSARNISASAKPENFSRKYIRYSDCITTLSTETRFNQLSDLSNGSIAAFQGATHVFGPEFASAVSKNKNYEEINDQLIQIYKLISGKVDAVVADIYIAEYRKKEFMKTHLNTPIKSSKIKCAFALPSVPYGVYFKDRAYVDAFNKGFDEIYKEGTYEKILKKYHMQDRIKGM